MSIILTIECDHFDRLVDIYPDKDSAIDAYNHLVTDKTISSMMVWDDETDMIIRDYTRG